MGLLIQTARRLERTARTLRKISKEWAEFKGVCRESWQHGLAKQKTRVWLMEHEPERIWEV